MELICSPVDSSTVEVSNLKLYVELSNLRVFDVPGSPVDVNSIKVVMLSGPKVETFGLPVVEKSLVGSNDEVSNIR